MDEISVYCADRDEHLPVEGVVFLGEPVCLKYLSVYYPGRVAGIFRHSRGGEYRIPDTFQSSEEQEPITLFDISGSRPIFRAIGNIPKVKISILP